MVFGIGMAACGGVTRAASASVVGASLSLPPVLQRLRLLLLQMLQPVLPPSRLWMRDLVVPGFLLLLASMVFKPEACQRVP